MSHSSKVTQSFGAVQTSGGVVQTLSGTALGALSLSNKISAVITTGAATAQLADGKPGQEKIISMVTDGGDLVLTVANLVGGTTLTFSAVGQSAHLVFLKGKWHVIANAAALA